MCVPSPNPPYLYIFVSLMATLTLDETPTHVCAANARCLSACVCLCLKLARIRSTHVCVERLLHVCGVMLPCLVETSSLHAFGWPQMARHRHRRPNAYRDRDPPSWDSNQPHDRREIGKMKVERARLCLKEMDPRATGLSLSGPSCASPFPISSWPRRSVEALPSASPTPSPLQAPRCKNRRQRTRNP